MDRTTDPVLLPYRHDQRLERLAAWLARDLAAAPVADPLAREWIVIPHPGMGRWLERELARHWGVAAALELVLPGRLLWQLAARIAGHEGAESPWERERLALRIQGQLPGSGDGPDPVRWPEALQALLRQPRAAWELAQRLARRYEEYLLYRPDWILAWEAGARALPQEPDEAWQAALWRRLVRGSAVPHRAGMRAQALARLVAAEPGSLAGLPARLSVFGLPALAPPQLELLAALGRHVDLHWYHLNPGSGWWADMRSAAERARLRRRRAGDEDEPEPAHSLLASWGRVGRDFLQGLYGEGGFAIHELGDPEPPAAGSLLGWLQRGLWEVDPAAVAPPALERARESLEIRACATALREVEVLHDDLLRAFDADPALAPHEVVVLTPDIERYGPLVDAVFGAASDECRIPWSVADRGAGGRSGLAAAFLQLLALPQSRLRAGEVLDLLRIPAIARRHGIDGDGHARAQAWVDATGVRWGLDAAFRAELELGDHGDGSWRAGLDRLWLGVAAGDVDGLVAGLRPWSDIEGAEVDDAAALTRCVETLAAWRRRLRAPRPAAAWADAGRALLADFCDEDGADADERAALDAVREALVALESDAALAGVADFALDPVAARAEIEARLALPAARQPFPGSGITVCAMVPMRNVPFRHVHVLGLDATRYPRPSRDEAQDLLRAARRAGDRDLRDDDRYLFLETLLATRERLVLSYTCLAPRDGASQAASPLVEELLDFVRAAYPGVPAGDFRAALVRVPPAQAHSAANFAAAAPSSYAVQWLPLARAGAVPPIVVAAPPWPGQAGESGGAPVESGIDLAALLRFARHPARDMARVLVGYVEDAAPALGDDEDFALDGLGRFRLVERLVELLAADELPRGHVLRAVRAEGLLPAGHAALAPFDEACERARRLLRALRAGPGLAPADAPRMIAVSCGPWRITGSLPILDSRGVVLARAGRWHGQHALELALSAKLGCMAGLATQPAWALAESGPAVEAWRLDATRLSEDWLARFIGLYQRSRCVPLPLWRKTSWAHANANEAERMKAARAEWEDGFRHGGEHGDPATAVLARAFDDPLGAEFEQVSRELLVPVAAVMEPVHV